MSRQLSRGGGTLQGAWRHARALGGCRRRGVPRLLLPARTGKQNCSPARTSTRAHRGDTGAYDMAPLWPLERTHFVASSELQFVGSAACGIPPPAQFSAGGLKTWRAISLLRKAASTQHLVGSFNALARTAGKLAKCCLTPRSKGAPAAGHQARSGGTRYIFASPGLASHRRCPLSSNVRRHSHTACPLVLSWSRDCPSPS